MKFYVDKQTLNDLSIFESYREENSIIGLFKPKSLRGKEKLKELFNNPITSIENIEDRQSAIRHIQEYGFHLEIDKEDLDFIDHYLSRGNKPTTISKYRAWEKGVWNYIKPTNAYYIIRTGVSDTLQQLNAVYDWAKNEQANELPSLLSSFINTVITTLGHPDFSLVLNLKHKKRLKILNIYYCDYLFRYLAYDRIMHILDIIYQLDVLQSVGVTAKEYNFCYPDFEHKSSTSINIKGLYHPFLKDPVKNDVFIGSDKNVCFVTGSNMAGKSTLLKSIGVSVYLAHLGFPVPAEAMKTTVLNGLITTINISDDLTKGYSHFYSEVQRVKEVAIMVKTTPTILVIFDELFRGTNVKDAFDASTAIIEAFTTVKGSLFFISTHIVEVAKELEATKSIDFKYLETVYKNNEPVFSYKIKEGITEERIGMWIIEKEGIIDIIKQKP